MTISHPTEGGGEAEVTNTMKKADFILETFEDNDEKYSELLGGYEGEVLVYEGDFGPFLIVAGGVKAKNIIAGGSEIYISGDVEVENVIYGHYNHGILDISSGNVKTKVLINDDHDLRVRDVDGIVIDLSNHMMKGTDFDCDDADRILVSDVYDPEEGFLLIGKPQALTPDK